LEFFSGSDGSHTCKYVRNRLFVQLARLESVGPALALIRSRRRQAAAQGLALAAAAVAMAALIGYIYGVPSLSGPPQFVLIAPTTVVAFLILTIGVLLVAPERGLMSALTNETAGGQMARRLLPMALLPVVAGRLIQAGREAGWFSPQVQAALDALIATYVIVGFIWWNAGWLRRIDEDRRRATDELSRTLETLEHRVAERTGELSESNAALQAEIAERKRTGEAMRLQAHLIDAAHDAILIRELGGTIASWNQGAERMYGWTRDQAIGRIAHDLLKTRFPKPQAEIVEDMVRDGSWEGELTRARPDGGLATVASRWVLARDAGGGAGVILEINSDITERKRAEQEIRLLNEQLEQRVRERTAQLDAANKELEGFAYSVSHDLRAPLRAIDGFSQMLMTEHATGLAEEPRRLLQRVSENSRKMGRLIDDLLRFSRLGRQGMKRQPVATAELVRQCLDDLADERQGRPVELAIGELPPGQGDPALLKQVWLNLLANALKFTRTRDPARVEVGSFARDGETVYFVRDNGVGFDMAYVDKLFGVFQRLHRQEEYEGTGVGLALTQRIVYRHGGRAWAEAQPGRGATFFFTLGRSNTDAESPVR
jgi:PAS domain S-box-containing protein